jgi:hypothetical protein
MNDHDSICSWAEIALLLLLGLLEKTGVCAERIERLIGMKSGSLPIIPQVAPSAPAADEK